MTAPARRPWWKKKRWAAAITAGWLIAYGLSYGPACRIYWETEDSRVSEAIGVIYLPIEWPEVHGPQWYRDTVGWYVGLWHSPDWDEEAASD